MTSVGFVGLGNMGLGMARNLARRAFPAATGQPRLCLLDNAPGRAAELRRTLQLDPDVTPGLEVVAATDLAVLGRTCETVCLSLPSEAAGRAVLEGLLADASPTLQCVVDHGTVSPDYSRACLDACAARGVTYLDAPVSGGPEGAANGTLSIMVGADDSAEFDRQKQVLDAMGGYVVLLGPAGAGTAAKLVNQMLVGIHTVAAAEAVSLAQALGVTDVRPLLELLDRSWGNSVMLQRSGGLLLEAQQQQKQLDGVADSDGPFAAIAHMPSGAPVRNLVKDMDLIKAAAKDLPLSSMRAAHATYHAAADSGLQDADLATLALLVERQRQASRKAP